MAHMDKPMPELEELDERIDQPSPKSEAHPKFSIPAFSVQVIVQLAAGFTHSQGLSGDKQNTLASLWVNAMQHGMIWVGLGELVEGTAPDKVNRLSSYSGAMAQTDGGQEQVNDGDRKTAAILGRRVAETAARWAKGK